MFETHSNPEDNTEELGRLILKKLNEQEPAELWYSNSPNEKIERANIRGFQMYLDEKNNKIPRKEKIKYLRWVFVHSLSANASISLEDLGVEKKEINEIEKEEAIKFITNMLKRLRDDSLKTEAEFGISSPNQRKAVSWASGRKKVEAIRDMMNKHEITCEEIGSSDEELDRLSKWTPPV